MIVQLLDLRGQYKVIRDELLPQVERLLESQQFILGSPVETFEAEAASYCGTEFGIGVASGSDALLLSLMAADIGPGDEVITTPYTFFATASAVTRLGAKPVFADIDPLSCNIDPSAIEGKVTERTRAIIPVHLYGQAADMDPILKLAARHNLLVIEDAAQAIGTEYKGKRAGSIGDTGCLSFFPSKNLGGFGDGGMVVTKRRDLADRIRMLRGHGMNPKYVHKLVGINSRLDALQAVVLSVKLRYLDQWQGKRKENAERYNHLFRHTDLFQDQAVVLPREIYAGEAGNTHVYNQYVIRARDRDGLRVYLETQGVGTEIYYPIPLHLQECFTSLGYGAGDFPESERAAKETLALPIYPELTPEMQEYVVDRIKAFYRGGK
ncbi:MAG: DegT/DnrJ/EryC1/StrS family aminotransferase [bacterium]